MNSVWDDKNLNFKFLMTTVTGVFCTNKLFDEPESIVIRVMVSLVVREHGLLVESTLHEVESSHKVSLMRF